MGKQVRKSVVTSKQEFRGGLSLSHKYTQTHTNPLLWAIVTHVNPLSFALLPRKDFFFSFSSFFFLSFFKGGEERKEKNMRDLRYSTAKKCHGDKKYLGGEKIDGEWEVR